MARAGTCPQCGAPIEFRWSSAVQTVCAYCNSILVRHDVDVARVGEVADLPPDSSPIQIDSEGVYNGKAFVVAGRILYEYEQGGWNEWHLMFQDGASGWLADAQAMYQVSFLKDIGRPLPLSAEVARGQRYRFDGVDYQVTARTAARYRGVEGELPFEYWDKAEVLFADLRASGGRFATIDYSEEPALLFAGEAVEFDDLKLKNLREFEGW
jgi:hypothetical protein